MGNRRIGQHTLDVRLGNRYEVTKDQGSSSNQPEGLLPSSSGFPTLEDKGGQRNRDDPQKRSETANLRANAHESGNRSRRTFINIGCPHVERNDRDLKA